MDGSHPIGKNLLASPPKHIDIKKPTHVPVHRTQVINEPKKFE